MAVLQYNQSAVAACHVRLFSSLSPHAHIPRLSVANRQQLRYRSHAPGSAEHLEPVLHPLNGRQPSNASKLLNTSSARAYSLDARFPSSSLYSSHAPSTPPRRDRKIPISVPVAHDALVPRARRVRRAEDVVRAAEGEGGECEDRAAAVARSSAVVHSAGGVGGEIRT